MARGRKPKNGAPGVSKKKMRYNTRTGTVTECTCYGMDRTPANCPHDDTLQESGLTAAELEATPAAREKQYQYICSYCASDPIELRRSVAHSMLERWKNGQKRMLCVLPTGFGKSALAHRLTAENVHAGKRVLVLVPTEELQGQFSEKHFMRASTGYDTFCYASIKDAVQWVREHPGEYGAVVFDEAHRMLAKTWEEPCLELERLVQEGGGQSLWITATPQRHTEDGGRLNAPMNICERLGDPDVYVSMEDAVEAGVYCNLPDYRHLPGFAEREAIDRVLSLKENGQAVWSLSREQRKTLEGIRDAMDAALQPEAIDARILKGLDGLVQTRNHAIKVAFFCNSIDGEGDPWSSQSLMPRMKAYLQEKYPDYAIEHCEYNSKHGDRNTRKWVERFANDSIQLPRKTIQVVYTVEKFNEGFHVDDLDLGVILEGTQSPIKYRQRVGRFFGRMKERPLVLDFAGADHRVVRQFDWGRVDAWALEHEGNAVRTVDPSINALYAMLMEADGTIQRAKGAAVWKDEIGKRYVGYQEVAQAVRRPEGVHSKKQWERMIGLAVRAGADPNWLEAHAPELAKRYKWNETPVVFQDYVKNLYERTKNKAK